MSDFTDEFIKNLNDRFPEKVVYLLGIEYNDNELESYILDNLLTPITFAPKEFKEHIHLKIVDFTLNSVSIVNDSLHYNTGDVVYNPTSSQLKLFDGENWINIDTNSSNTQFNYKL